MKKIILGFIAVLAIGFTAPVSFASDGPETTKDCVVSVNEVMETLEGANEIELSVANSVIVVGTQSNEASVITMVATNEPVNQFILFNEVRIDTLFNVHYGLPSIIEFAHNTTDKTNGTLFRYNNPNCLCRYLSQG